MAAPAIGTAPPRRRKAGLRPALAGPVTPLPVLLDLTGLPCVVVGGGRVAERKASALRRAGARVRVVAPEVTPRLRNLARRGSIVWFRKRFANAHLRGAWLAVAATSDAAVNRAVAREGRRRRMLVNVADAPETGSFRMPAVLVRGPLRIAVSTSGESPALARAIRDGIARRHGPEYCAWVRLVGSVRRRLLAGVPDRAERERRARRLLRAPLLRLIRSGRMNEARRAALAAAGLT